MFNKIDVPSDIIKTMINLGSNGSIKFHRKLLYYLDNNILSMDSILPEDLVEFYREKIQILVLASRSGLSGEALYQFLETFQPTDDAIAELDQFFEMLEDILPYEQDNVLRLGI